MLEPVLAQPNAVEPAHERALHLHIFVVCRVAVLVARERGHVEELRSGRVGRADAAVLQHTRQEVIVGVVAPVRLKAPHLPDAEVAGWVVHVNEALAAAATTATARWHSCCSTLTGVRLCAVDAVVRRRAHANTAHAASMIAAAAEAAGCG
eukprot:5821260-Prymnesium_polylepis.3